MRKGQGVCSGLGTWAKNLLTETGNMGDWRRWVPCEWGEFAVPVKHLEKDVPYTNIAPYTKCDFMLMMSIWNLWIEIG